ncbi:hypothetical protein GW17_00016471 [Ensete ventricosum]|nr:hypothetical protein GW17_00016471 [Ensete ventricosum]
MRFFEGIGKLAENTSGHRRKKTRRLTARMSEAAGLAGDLEGFARRFVKGIGKLAVNTSGNHRKKTRRLTIRMLEATRLMGVRS